MGLTNNIDLDALHRELIESLQGIVNANWRNWVELGSPEEFERWAKSRANHMIARIRDMERRAGASAWQPIETAPKDGARLLLAAEGRTCYGHWYSTYSRWEYDGYDFGNPKSQPTHWMPLPAPPISAGRAAEGGKP